VQRIFKPFSVLKKKNMKVSFILWLVFVIIIGQIGIIASIISNWHTLGFNAIILNYKFGNLYVFTVACLSFGIYDYFNEYYLKRELRFRGIKIVTAAIALCLIFLVLIIFSSNHLPLNSTVSQIARQWDWLGVTWQIILYSSAVILSVYMFCVNKLDLFSDEYSDLDDFIYLENENIKALEEKVLDIATEDGGIEL
jgi:hypothetical protein